MRDVPEFIDMYREGEKLAFPLCAAFVQDQLTQPLVDK